MGGEEDDCGLAERERERDVMGWNGMVESYVSYRIKREREKRVSGERWRS